MTTLSKELSLKYSAYHSAYEPKNQWPDMEFIPGGPSELLDACFTGCKLLHARHSIDTYSIEIENDIKEIIRQSPQTIHCTLGRMRCRNNITPLAAACHNLNIPIHMIDFLLQNGADMNYPILLDNGEISILDDIELNYGVDSERYQQISELFSLYNGINIKRAS